MMKKIEFKINGQKITLETEANRRLLDILRQDLKLTGTKEGCAIGECGACTVVLNGKAVNSCLILAPQVDGAEILTVEGLEKEGRLQLVQEKFLQHGAVQCGFCTPGMLMSAYALLLENPHPDKENVKDAIAGNLCRCTGYQQIIAAILASQL